MANYGHEQGSNPYDPQPSGVGPGGYGSPYGEPSAGPPPSVRRAVMLIWVSVGLGVLSSIVGFALIDDLIDQSLNAQPGGGAQLDRDAVRSAVVIGLGFGIVLSVAIAALFAWLIGKGKNWARIVYTILLVGGILFGLLGLGSQPVVLVLLQLVSFALSVAILVLLYRSDSNAYFSRS